MQHVRQLGSAATDSRAIHRSRIWRFQNENGKNDNRSSRPAPNEQPPNSSSYQFRHHRANTTAQLPCLTPTGKQRGEHQTDED